MNIKKRIIPVLLLQDSGLVKTINFKDPKYIGDPINAVRIFNEKEVHELFFLDISDDRYLKGPNFNKLARVASEAFMPMGYGGGITKIEHIEKIFKIGFEKVILNSAVYEGLDFIKSAIKRYGSQSIVASVDVKKDLFGRYRLYTHSGRKKMSSSLDEHLELVIQLGFGELFLNSIDRDGTFSGYDTELIRMVCERISIPVVGCGGAGSISDLTTLLKKYKVSAAAAGSIFVYYGSQRAVLINYPSREKQKLSSN